jgi:hypothetical protein
MLNRIRKINMPTEINLIGPLIDGQIVGQVSDYNSLIDIARMNAEAIKQDAMQESIRIAETTRAEVSKSVRTDFVKIVDFFENEYLRTIQKSSDICLQVTKTAVHDFIQKIDDKTLLEKMISSLISQKQKNSNLNILINPDQFEIVQELVKKELKFAFRSGDYTIHADESIDKDQVKMIFDTGAYIEISRNNLIGIFTNEIDLISDYFVDQTKTSIDKKKKLFNNKTNESNHFENQEI